MSDARKGLKFPVLELPGVRHMPAPSGDEKEAARVFHVTATRTTQKMVFTVSGNGEFGSRLGT